MGETRSRFAALLTALSVLVTPWGAAAASPVRGLDPAKAMTQYRLDVWTTEEGLPQNTVNAILQTRDGYLWLGTYDGLARFDGIRFTVFNKGNASELRTSGIRSLCEDRDGSMWIGTNGGGLSRLKDGRFIHYSAKDGVPDDMIWALHADREGGVWVGSSAGGLYRFQNGRFRSYPGSSGESIYKIQQDRQGDIWLATNGGLKRLARDGTWTKYTTADGLPRDFVGNILVDRQGSLWVGSGGGGLVRLKDGHFRRYSTRDGLASDLVTSLYEDREGSLWIGTGGGGLARFRDGVFTTLAEKDGLPGNVVYSIQEDREGSLWIGTNGAGLCRLRDTSFTTYTTREGLSHDYVYPIFQDKGGSVWVGTSSGLNRFQEGRWAQYTTRDGLCHDIVRSIEEDRNGDLWVGTYGGGACKRLAKGWKAYTTRDGLAHDSVRAVLSARSGSLWFGTVGGLSRLKDGAWETFTTRDGLPRNSILCLREGRDGSLWIGTDGGGLSRYREGGFRTYTPKDGLASNVVLTLHEDEEGVLWIGTNGGLTRLERGRFSTFTTRAGLPSDSINQILDDGKGSLWIGSSRGVSRVSKAAIEDFVQGRTVRLSLRDYGKIDGLRSIQCTAPAQPAGWRARDGRLWFATASGVAVVDPRGLRTDAEPPPVFIETVAADDRAFEPGAAFTLGPGTERIAFHYTGLCLLAPERVRFRYKLEGFDANWVDAGERRIAYYTRLPPGQYRFRASACNADGVCNEQGASVSLRLLPRFHQTLWFYLASTVGVLLVAVGAYRARIGHLKARERELTALVEERTRKVLEEKEKAEQASREAERQKRIAEEANAMKTELLGIAAHDLKNPLQTIMGSAEIISMKATDPTQVGEMAEGIYRSSWRMLNLIRDLLAAAAFEGGELELRKRRIDLGELAKSILDEHGRQAERKNLKLVHSADEGCLVEVDEDRMRQVIENLLGNAVKFSPPGRTVGVKVRRQPDTVRLEVTDEGQGLTEEDTGGLFGRFERLSARPTAGESSTGLGLSIVKRLVELHGGRVWAESQGRDQGCTFLVELPRAVGESPGTGGGP